MSVRQSKVLPSPSCPFEMRHDIEYRGKGATAPKKIEKTSGDSGRETRIGDECLGKESDVADNVEPDSIYRVRIISPSVEIVCERMSCRS